MYFNGVIKPKSKAIVFMRCFLCGTRIWEAKYVF